LQVDATERELLTTWSKSQVLPQRQVMRAKICLLAAAGTPNLEIARRLGCSLPTVGKWRQRFQEAGMDGLGDQPGRGSSCQELCKSHPGGRFKSGGSFLR
jgi:DNA-directed RNA polymerase specialized sigma24 family protein